MGKENKGKNEEEKEEKKHTDGEKLFVEEKRNVAEDSKFVQENRNISEGIHASLPVAAVMAGTNDDVFNGRVPVVEEICVQTRIAPKTSNSNSKQKKFSKDDLKSLRSNFANKQGVHEVVEPIYDDHIKKSSIQENETQLMQTKNLIKGEENGDLEGTSCKYNDQILNNKMNSEIPKEQETEHLADKSSGLIDIVQDFKDFSSLKRKPKVKPVEPDTAQTNSSDIKVENIPKEQIFQNEGKESSENTTSLSVCVDEKKNKKISRVTLQEDKETTPDNFKPDGDTFTTSGPALDKEDQMASSIPSIHMKSSTEDGIIGSSSQSIHVKTDRDDDIIGFDIRHEEEKERQRLADEALWEPAPAPFELPKSEVKKMETKVVSRPETPKVIDMAEPTMTPEQKEKRGNFIKDWQRDLKEFFSLGKSKKNEKSMRSHKSSLSSKSSSMTLERADSRTFGEKKTNVSEIPNRSEQNESKEEPRNDSNETPVKVETMESNDKMQEEQKQLEEAGGVEETEKKDDGNKETVSVRRSKRDRKSRRKTNSESSTPRHSIPSSPGEEEKKIGHVGETEQQVENVGIVSHIQGSQEEVQETRKVCHM